jgi:nitrite reductase/ring-hydroxylating ferredoxin subunit
MNILIKNPKIYPCQSHSSGTPFSKENSERQEGRVMTVQAGHKELSLSHFEGKFKALDNKCPHQDGPLGEGSIEK